MQTLFRKVLIPAAVLLSCITFTPIVIPYGINRPTLFSLPLTLWAGMIVSVLLVFLTYLAARSHPGNEEDET